MTKGDNKGRELPRRVYQDLWNTAEKAIYDAMQEVEKMPADVRLTKAVILLSDAKDCVADFLDGVVKKEPKS
jgi:hypothetical protein